MTQKRILIKEVTAPCNGCSGAGENVCDNCYDYWHVWNSCLTREKAIRKMCDGYFKAKDKGKTESERVEAALDELLGKKSV